MLYLILSIEVIVTGLLLYWRVKKFRALKQHLNPQGLDETHHTLVKTGKTKRLRKARAKHINTVVLLATMGATAVAITLFINAAAIVQAYQDEGML